MNPRELPRPGEEFAARRHSATLGSCAHYGRRPSPAKP